MNPSKPTPSAPPQEIIDMINRVIAYEIAKSLERFIYGSSLEEAYAMNAAIDERKALEQMLGDAEPAKTKGRL